MTASDFRISCAKLNMNYTEMAKELKVTPRTCSLWANGNHKIPYASAKLIEQIVKERCIENEQEFKAT